MQECPSGDIVTPDANSDVQFSDGIQRRLAAHRTVKNRIIAYFAIHARTIVRMRPSVSRYFILISVTANCVSKFKSLYFYCSGGLIMLYILWLIG